jgi:Uma2 family endonuclease
LPNPKYTIEQYIELEQFSEERYEYFDGEVFAMTGGRCRSAKFIRACNSRRQHRREAEPVVRNPLPNLSQPATLCPVPLPKIR